jgi:hypothetical protein
MSALHNTLRRIPPNIKSNLDFLELGYFEIENIGNNFVNVDGFKSKESVDMANSNATYHMMTDDFFAQNTNTYDIIYIDAGHDWETVLRDYNNSVKVLNKGGIIFFHDLYPTPELATPAYCGDGFNLLNYFHNHSSDFNFLVYRPDVGTTCLWEKFPVVSREDVVPLTYGEFISSILSCEYITDNFEEFVQNFLQKL